MENKTLITAEDFLREKLESEIQICGDGNTEFHTRDLSHLLDCLKEKDNLVVELTDALKICFASLGTYGRHPIIELQVNNTLKKV